MVEVRDKGLTPEEVKGIHEPDPEIVALRSKVNTLTHLVDDLRKGEGQLKILFGDMRREISRLAPQPDYYSPPTAKKTVSSPCSAVLHLTDHHIGAVQEASEIEGFGEYSPEIAERRLVKQCIPTFLDWVELHRKIYTIDEAVVIVTGDLISGDIHSELSRTNAFPVPVQVVRAGWLNSDAIATISPHFKSVRVEFVTEDNHGRLTKIPQSKEAGYNTHNYVVGVIIQERLKDLPNVTFNLYPMFSKSVRVRKTRYLCMHGHGIRGWAGFPYYGLERAAGREALKRMNRPDFAKFHKVLLGHFHSPLNHEKYMIGGSLSGTDAYDHKNGREAVPCQTAWLVHPKHGEFDWTKFRLN